MRFLKSPKSKIFFSLWILLLFSNLILTIIFTSNNNDLMAVYEDVDRKSNGNTLIAGDTLPEILRHPWRAKNQIPVEENNPQHKVIEIDQQGRIIWKITGVAYPHEVLELPNGNLLIADCGHDRIIEVDYPNTNIIWTWEPKYINWTEINPSWGENHYYNNPIVYDWTHLNDVDYKDYGSWSALLISLRNFNLVLELNFTNEKLDPYNSSNIVWYFGDYDNHLLLNHQHNPDYLENGNILIADSDNRRIIEVNYTDFSIDWEYELNLKWARDADSLSNGNILITDTDRVFEINKTTKEILWEFKGDLISAYESDKLDNGNILIGCGLGSVVYEVSPNGVIVWRFGMSFAKSLIYLNVILFSLIEVISLYFTSQKIRKTQRSDRISKRIWNYVKIAILLFLISTNIILIITYTQILMNMLFSLK